MEETAFSNPQVSIVEPGLGNQQTDIAQNPVQYLQNHLTKLSRTKIKIFNFLEKKVLGTQASMDELQIITEKLIELGRHDDCTLAHSLRVASMVLKFVEYQHSFGRYKEIDPGEIFISGLLHDLGKEGIGKVLLNKPGRLTPPEILIMALHQYLSVAHLNQTKGLQFDAHKLRHHAYCSEDLNGMTLTGRVLGVIDAYEAIRDGGRPYKAAKSESVTKEIIRGDSGKRMDAQVAEDFLEFLESKENSGTTLFDIVFEENFEFIESIKALPSRTVDSAFDHLRTASRRPLSNHPLVSIPDFGKAEVLNISLTGILVKSKAMPGNPDGLKEDSSISLNLDFGELVGVTGSGRCAVELKLARLDPISATWAFVFQNLSQETQQKLVSAIVALNHRENERISVLDTGMIQILDDRAGINDPLDISQTGVSFLSKKGALKHGDKVVVLLKLPLFKDDKEIVVKEHKVTTTIKNIFGSREKLATNDLEFELDKVGAEFDNTSEVSGDLYQAINFLQMEQGAYAGIPPLIRAAIRSLTQQDV